MGMYKASEAKQHEFQSADTFRLEKSGDRAQVVFLYTDESSIDGYTCHRLTNAKYYTYTVDCCKAEKGECPACSDNVRQSNRIFVKMLDLTNNKVVIWDRAAGFRQTLEGFIHYFKPLYGQKYEITKQGEKLKTTYNFQSIGESGITEKDYKAYLAKADEAIEAYVRPAESYDDVKNKVAASAAEAMEAPQQVGAPTASAWNTPVQPQSWAQQSAAPQPSWNQPSVAPQQPAWGQVPPQNVPQTAAWNNAPQQPASPQNSTWGQPTPAPNGDAPF